MDERFSRLLASTRSRYDNSDPGHDFAHIQRVLGSVRRIAESVDADLTILLPAALLHDVINVPKNHPDRALASAKAAAAAHAILSEADYSEAEIEKIRTVITEHSYSLGKAPSCLESAVLQDADRLDAIGAIGVMRMVTCGARMGSRYYDEAEPIVKTRALDDKQNTIDHVAVKLSKLADNMNTPYGKQEAARRSAFMHAFIAQLMTEIDFNPTP